MRYLWIAATRRDGTAEAVALTYLVMGILLQMLGVILDGHIWTSLLAFCIGTGPAIAILGLGVAWHDEVQTVRTAEATARWLEQWELYKQENAR